MGPVCDLAGTYLVAFRSAVYRPQPLSELGGGAGLPHYFRAGATGDRVADGVSDVSGV